MSFLKKTKNGYLYAISDEKDMDDTNPVNSDLIVEQLGGKKRQIGIEITTAGSDVVADLSIYGSFNGVDFIAIGDVIADTQPNVTGVKTALFDLAAYELPYYRLVFNEAGVAVGSSGKFKFIYGA